MRQEENRLRFSGLRILSERKKVFLGGTVKSEWRHFLLKYLKCEYINPVQPDWTVEKDLVLKDLCNIHLYVVTANQQSVYVYAEAVESACNPLVTTIFAFGHDLHTQLTNDQWESLTHVGKCVERCGGTFFNTLNMADLASYINNLGVEYV